MKNFVFTFFLLILIISGSAQTANLFPNPSYVGKGEITFETDVHNFDTIEYAGNGTYEFKFKNTGTEPFVIKNAQGSCGCTVPTYPKDVPIKPGETQAIKVTYDTKRPGSFVKTVTISSNALDSIKVITIKGYVNKKVTEPSFSIDGKKTDGFVPLERH
jgi:hypothetical protein